MKHIFVINPKAGGQDGSRAIAAMLGGLGVEAELYTTRAQRDATRFVAERCGEGVGEGLRFYACGGDGTLNEVVSGVVGVEGVEVACYPCGSGNDYVKYYPEGRFADVAALMRGEAVEVDVMRVEGGDDVRYCLNTLNFGFEAEVCRTMAGVRRTPIVGGKVAYTTGIVRSLATSRRNPCRVEVDGERWHEGDLLLMSLANGRYAGGGYKCAPRAVNDDGLLEVMAIRPMSVVRFAGLIKHYERGEHLDMPELASTIAYRRGRKVTVESEDEFYIAIDGEVIGGKHFEVSNLQRAVKFVVPRAAININERG